jgi:hypothetical protein
MTVSDLELSGKSTRSCDCHNHCFVRSTRVTYVVIIVKAGKVRTQMEGPGNNPDETLSRTCP